MQTIVDNSGFDSVTDFIVYVLRDLVSTSAARANAAPPHVEEDPFTPEELALVTERLKALGYL